MRNNIEPGRYAREIRTAMRRMTDPETDAPLKLRGLQRMLEAKGHPYSYEHLRKVLCGMPVLSEECNDAICKLLYLDAGRMWSFAQAEKALRRFGSLPVRLAAPADPRMRDVWDQLSVRDQEDLIRIAEGRAAQGRMIESTTR